MNVLTLGLGAFGFAMSKVLGENNPDKIFYGYGINEEITLSLKQTRKHPYFFNGYELPSNIEIIDNINDFNSIIGSIDLLILAIPAQAISGEIDSLKDKLKPGVSILNLAKGVDIKTNYPISKLIASKLGSFDYSYFILSGGMIAQAVVEGRMLGADLGCSNQPHPTHSNQPHPSHSNQPHPSPLLRGEGIEGGYKKNGENFGEDFRERCGCGDIKGLLENDNLKIKIVDDLVNVELYGCLKNVMAILTGYYEGKGEGSSSIGYHLVCYYDEMKEIIKLYGGNPVFDFSYYSLGGDIIASCFGDSRNRYFGKLLGSGKKINDILVQLEAENKHSEGYETLKAVYEMIKDKDGFEITKFLYSLVN